MEHVHTLAEYFASALVVGFHAAVPVLAAVVAAAVVASIVQALVGVGDPAIGLAFRATAAAAAIAVFGRWSAHMVMDFWHKAWQAASAVLGGGL